jgi:tRNA pseudouridine38-40 synthase
MAMRIALGVEYNGSRFYGWQTQKQEPTVQQVLERALAKVAAAPVDIMCAGRTDTGVHAHCQVAHFDTESERSERSWVLGANTNLPDGATVLWARHMDGSFHARHSALARSYQYHILNRWTRPALDATRSSWVREQLDAERMHEAAQALVGEHDFSSFRAIGCQSTTPWRNLHSIKVWREGDEVKVAVKANAFVYHMVRNLVGSLLEVGRGVKPVEWIGEVLQQRDRTQAGPTAPSCGLYFVAPHYDPSWNLPTHDTPAFPRGWNLS